MIEKFCLLSAHKHTCIIYTRYSPRANRQERRRFVKSAVSTSGIFSFSCYFPLFRTTASKLENNRKKPKKKISIKRLNRNRFDQGVLRGTHDGRVPPDNGNISFRSHRTRLTFAIRTDILYINNITDSGIE